MKKILLILLPLFVLSCTTLPNASEKGVLIIPSEVNAGAGSMTFGEYQVTILNLDTKAQIVKKIMARNSLNKIILDAGVYKIVSLDFVYSDTGRKGSSGSGISNYSTFKISEGGIYVYPYKLLTIMSSEGTMMSIRRKSQKITENDKISYIKKLSKAKDFDSWTVFFL